jgi:DNA-binding NarL/FixJ family response regulator
VSLLERLEQAGPVVEVSSRAELMNRLTDYPAAVVLLDYTLFDFSDVQLMNMKQKYQQSLWILFSEELSKHFLRQVLLSGQLFSVVMKTDSMDDIIQTFSKALNGEIYLCAIAEQLLLESEPSKITPDKLTASERLILHEIAMGKTTKEIAYDQHLSFHTINTHRKNIFRKLEVNNVHEAIKYALRAGVMDLAEYYI